MKIEGKFQMEVDEQRGVLYLHRLDGPYAGSTALRACGIDTRYFVPGYENNLLDLSVRSLEDPDEHRALQTVRSLIAQFRAAVLVQNTDEQNRLLTQMEGTINRALRYR